MEQPMNLPEIVSREEWVVARTGLLAQEKEFTRTRDRLNAQRRRLPMVRIDKEYVFEASEDNATLLDLFAGRRQLIVYHFMFGPDWDAGCEGCSILVDNIGHPAHLHARDTSLVLVSRAPLPKLLAFQKRMGWTTPWYSSYNSDFNHDFHVTLDERVVPVEHNFEDRAALERRGLTALGRKEPWEQPPGRSWLPAGGWWWRRHDEYRAEGQGAGVVAAKRGC